MAAMQGARVLIVEDEFLVAANLEAGLEERGFVPVGVAPDLETALKLAEAKPDIALVDIHLQDGETGPQIASRLANDFGVRVVFVTANPQMAAATRGPGVIGVVNKPYTEDLIAQAIDYALRARDQSPLPAPPEGLMLLDDAS